MATPGGPEKVGAVSFDVNANIAPAQADLNKITGEAEKAGEEAGKAFNKGVEKGASEGGGAKWMGEGSDGFVGPARPTGAHEVSRQRALLGEDAAEINAGNAGGGGGAGAAAAGGGGAGPNQIVATITDLINVFQKFEAMGEMLSTLIGDNTKNLRDLQLAMSQDIELRRRAENTQDAQEKRRVAANPLIDIEGLQTQRSQLREEKDASEKFWQSHTSLATGDAVLGSLPITAMMTGEWGSMFSNWGSAITGDFGAMTGPFQQRAAGINAGREREAMGISNQLLGVTNRPNMSAGGILGMEADERGISHRPMSNDQTLDFMNAAAWQKMAHGLTNERLEKFIQMYSETNPERANRTVKNR